MTFKNSTIEINTTLGYTSVYAYNEILEIFDALAKTTTILDGSDFYYAPPFSTLFAYPYIVGSPATGEWVGQENKIAIYLHKESLFEGKWQFFDVPNGYFLNIAGDLVFRAIKLNGLWELKEVNTTAYANRPTHCATTTVTTSFPNPPSFNIYDFGRLFTFNGMSATTYTNEVIDNDQNTIVLDRTGYSISKFVWDSIPLLFIPSLYVQGYFPFRSGIFHLIFNNISPNNFDFNVVFENATNLDNNRSNPLAGITIMGNSFVFTVPPAGVELKFQTIINNGIVYLTGL